MLTINRFNCIIVGFIMNQNAQKNQITVLINELKYFCMYYFVCISCVSGWLRYSSYFWRLLERFISNSNFIKDKFDEFHFLLKLKTHGVLIGE